WVELMIVEQFLKWVESARTNERTAAAGALARAYLQSDLSIDERCAAEAALTVLLDDPSPNVRLALAEALSTSSYSPIHLITTLSADQPEIAAMVLVRSPLLADSDLIDRIALGSDEVQCAIAMRGQLSGAVSAAMSEVGCLSACQLLLKNTGAKVAKLSLRRLVERFGHNAGMRQLLLKDERLPADARHALVVKVGEALSAMPMVRALVGVARAERITKEACIRACLTLVDECGAAEHPALVEHLRLSGSLTTAFVLRTLINGKIGFYVTIISALSGQDEPRIKAQLSGGRRAALTALYRRCGFTDAVAALLMRGVDCWRAVANGKLQAGPQEVARIILEQFGADQPTPAFAHSNDDLVSLVRSIYLETVRENGRKHAQSIQAA
ncbi:MAG: DUF2336 domain-containing protein, partial [Rhizobiaceae bacterium]